MEAIHFAEKQLTTRTASVVRLQAIKMHHLGETIYHHEYRIITSLCAW